MSDYLVKDTDLTSVANAIRTKGGTSASLAFPADFMSAIAAIPTGGGGYTLEEVSDGPLTGDIVYNGTFVRPFLFYNSGITSFIGENVTTISINTKWGFGHAPYTFAESTSLISISLPKITDFYWSDNAFKNCTALANWGLNFKNITRLAGSLFYGCTHLPSLVLPKHNADFYSSCFRGCSNMEYLDIGGEALTANKNSFSANCFNGATKLNTLIIRHTNRIITLANINAFAGTPFASNGTGGTLYVPSSLVSTYQSATNWSTILGYANNQIKSIESTHTDPTAPIDLTLYYADGTLIPT